MLKYLKFLLGSIGFSTVQNKKHAHSRKLNYKKRVDFLAHMYYH
jgi:hypothetical protein